MLNELTIEPLVQISTFLSVSACIRPRHIHSNAPDLMRQVSASYSPLLPCHVLACRSLPCHHLLFISSHRVHSFLIRVCFMYPSIFPVVRFAIRRSYVPRRPLLPSFVSGY